MAENLPFSRTDIELTDRDIQFECDHCANILIVDKDGEGIELVCPHCGKPVTVPPYEPKPDPSREKEVGAGEAAAEAGGPSAVPGSDAAAEGDRPASGGAVPGGSGHPPPPDGPKSEREESARKPLPTFDFSDLSESDRAERLDKVEHKLKENRSQRMETQGNINRLTIDLHRQNLVMERLTRKNAELDAEREALRKTTSGG